MLFNCKPKPGRSNHFYAINFLTLHALPGGEAYALLRFEDRDTGAPESAGMNVDVTAAAVRHHETKALLVVEELDLALDHGTARGCVVFAAAATAIAATTAETVAAAITAAEAVAAAAITAAGVAIATGRAARRCGVGGRSVDCVDCHDL